MASPLDWLNVAPQPQTSLLTPAVSPYRTYGLTAADAVRQGQQALPKLQAASSYSDLLRQQALAPLKQRVEEMQLQNQIAVQPQIMQGRETLIQGLSSLDPASDDYLAQRRDIVMQNPYGLADPVVQQVLQANDRAYDDYISTKRLSMFNTPRTLTPGQRAAIERQVTNATEAFNKAQMMGDDAMAARYSQELQALTDLLAGSAAAAPGTAEAPAAPAPPVAPKTSGQKALEETKMAKLPEQERWTQAKEALAKAIAEEAKSLKTTSLEIQEAMKQDPNYAAEIIEQRLGAKPDAKVFDSPDTRSWWNGGTGVTWNDIVKTMLLPENEAVLKEASPAPQDKWEIKLVK